MKRLKTLVILTLFALSATAQTHLKEAETELFGKTEKNAKLSLESVQISQAGDLELGFFIQRDAIVDNTKSFQTLKSGYFPALKLMTFDSELNLKNTVFENINLNSLSGTNDDYILRADKIIEIGNNEKDLSYDDLQKKYPALLLPSDTKAEDEYFLQIERDLKKRKFSGQFDPLSNTLIQEETGIDKIDLQYPDSKLLRKEFGYGLANDKSDTYIFASGLFYDKKELKADKTKKYNEFRQYEICAFNQSGELKEVYKTDFDYPKIIKYYSDVYTNNEFKGFLYIFGYMPGARKYNNSDTKQNHWAVYFDENGKHVFTKEFESQYGSIFYKVHAFNEKLVVFAQGNDGKYGIITLSGSEYEQKSIYSSEITENTVNGSSENGIKKSFVPIYENVTDFVNADGSFLLIAQNKTSKPVVKDGQSSTVTTYNSFALAFDTNGNFQKQYILPTLDKASVSFPKTYIPVLSDENKFIILSEEMTNAKPYKKSSFMSFMTLNDKGEIDKCSMKYDKIPVLTVIDVSKTGFVKMKYASYYYADKENSCIYFVGLNSGRNKLKICKLAI